TLGAVHRATSRARGHLGRRRVARGNGHHATHLGGPADSTVCRQSHRRGGVRFRGLLRNGGTPAGSAGTRSSVPRKHQRGQCRVVPGNGRDPPSGRRGRGDGGGDRTCSGLAGPEHSGGGGRGPRVRGRRRTSPSSGQAEVG